jgi:hypothetical protein
LHHSKIRTNVGPEAALNDPTGNIPRDVADVVPLRLEQTIDYTDDFDGVGVMRIAGFPFQFQSRISASNELSEIVEPK